MYARDMFDFMKCGRCGGAAVAFHLQHLLLLGYKCSERDKLLDGIFAPTDADKVVQEISPPGEGILADLRARSNDGSVVSIGGGGEGTNKQHYDDRHRHISATQAVGDTSDFKYENASHSRRVSLLAVGRRVLSRGQFLTKSFAFSSPGQHVARRIEHSTKACRLFQTIR